MNFLPTRKAAAKLGIHPNTLRRWANAGKIPHFKTTAGQRRYDVDKYLGINSENELICYCRVSSYKQKEDLQRQVEFMQERFPDCKIVKDIGSGINFKRKGLKAILESAINGNKLKVVVAHKDRLCRFGFDLVEWIIQRSAGEIVVLKRSDLSPERELTQDLLTILHGFSCRMHGLRNYKNKIAEAFSDKGTEDNLQKLD